MDKKTKAKKTIPDTICRVHRSGGYAVLSNCFVRSTNIGCDSIGLLGKIGLVLGAPVYFLTRASIGMSGAIFAMGAVAAPAILCGIYKKNGVFLEKQVKFMREYFTRPRKRYYRTTNIFVSIERQIEYNRIKKKLRDAERKG